MRDRLVATRFDDDDRRRRRAAEDDEPVGFWGRLARSPLSAAGRIVGYLYVIAVAIYARPAAGDICALEDAAARAAPGTARNCVTLFFATPRAASAPQDRRFRLDADGYIDLSETNAFTTQKTRLSGTGDAPGLYLGKARVLAPPRAERADRATIAEADAGRGETRDTADRLRELGQARITSVVVAPQSAFAGDGVWDAQSRAHFGASYYDDVAAALRAAAGADGAQRAFLFVHGYDAGFDTTVKLAARYVADINAQCGEECREASGAAPDAFPFGQPMLYTWPTTHTFDRRFAQAGARAADRCGGTAGPLDAPRRAECAIEIARAAGVPIEDYQQAYTEGAAYAAAGLAEFLETLLLEADGLDELNIVAYSVGNHVVGQALPVFAAALAETVRGAPLTIRLVSVAADTDHETLKDAFSAFGDDPPSAAIYADHDDGALLLSAAVNAVGDAPSPRVGRAAAQPAGPDDLYAPAARAVQQSIDATGVSGGALNLMRPLYAQSDRTLLADAACFLRDKEPSERYLDPIGPGQYRLGDIDGLGLNGAEDDGRDPACRITPPPPIDCDGLLLARAEGFLPFWDQAGARRVAEAIDACKEAGAVDPCANEESCPLIGDAQTTAPPPPLSSPADIEVCETPAPFAFTVYFDLNAPRVGVRGWSAPALAAASTHADKFSGETEIARIDVVGHTDTAGEAADNEALAARRAAKVVDALIKYGAPRDKIDVEAMGERTPAVPTGDGVREAKNRRVEIMVVYKQICRSEPASGDQTRGGQ